MDYVIGCDVGSQSAKAILLSVTGQWIGEAAADYAIDYPHPMWAEQPVERWIEALTLAVRKLINTTQVDPTQIRALGLATQVDGIVAVDAAFQPLHPALIWMDRRAESQTDSVRHSFGADRAFELTGLNLDAVHGAPKIRWLLETYPNVRDNAAYFLLPGSYLAYVLTGELAVDYSNASSTLLMDVRTRTWSAEMARAFDIDLNSLAPIRPATAPLGRLRPTMAEVLGLSVNTIVVVGCGDEHAACLGVGVVQPGLVGDIVGTAEPVCAVSTQPIFDPTRLVETHCHADPDVWLLENPGFVSGGNLRWYRDHFGAVEMQAAIDQQASAYKILDEGAANVAPGSEGLIFLPCLMGATTPTWNSAARGTFTGFTLAHTRAHFTRALLEGSAYAVRDITDQLQKIGLGLREIRVMGGGAKSRLWNQIKADVTGLPVAVPHITETTALGAALLALVGIQAYGSLVEASQAIVKIVERLEPASDARAQYAEHYAHYRQVYFSLFGTS